ncbi:MAG: protein kinase, partial [Myxococcota bacterium]
MLLPKKVGSFTLMRKLDADGLSESFVAILDDPAGKQVVARRILPAVSRDPSRVSQLRARVGDLRAARHPSLVPVIDLVEADGDLYVLEDWSDGIELSAVLQYCLTNRTTVPHNVYLNLATQVCNALEALHGRPGTESGSENVLHLALSPMAMWIAGDGRVTVGRYGLARSPTALATAATGALPPGVEYLAPEQTHQDQKLTPASDIFSLGSILYELLTLKPMFRADSSLQTIHRVRRAEVTTQLLEVKDIMPGLDKVLFRALSLNPRHRYQRAFVLREDLRGLMAGYSFNDIDAVTRTFLSPIFSAKVERGPVEDAPAFSDHQGDTTGFLLGRGADAFSNVPQRGAGADDQDTDATDSLLLEESGAFDNNVEGDTDRHRPFESEFDPESEIDTAQNVREELANAFNTDTDDLRPGQNTGWVRRPPSDGDGAGRRPIESLDTSMAFEVEPPPPAPSSEDSMSLATSASLDTGDLADTGELPDRQQPARGNPAPKLASGGLGSGSLPVGDLDSRRSGALPGRVPDPPMWRSEVTGSHENTTNLLEPTTGPIPELDDNSPTAKERILDRRLPVRPPEPDTVPNPADAGRASGITTVPLIKPKPPEPGESVIDPVTLEVDPDSEQLPDTGKVPDTVSTITRSPFSTVPVPADNSDRFERTGNTRTSWEAMAPASGPPPSQVQTQTSGTAWTQPPKAPSARPTLLPDD